MKKLPWPGETMLIAFSTLVNIILAALIIFRLVYHRRRVKNVLGVEHGTVYTNIFFFFFNIRFIVRRGGASCWTSHIVYATPLAPMPVLPLPPQPSSASAQGTPLVIAPHANPAQKRCFRMRRSRIVRRCSTVFFVVF